MTESHLSSKTVALSLHSSECLILQLQLNHVNSILILPQYISPASEDLKNVLLSYLKDLCFT